MSGAIAAAVIGSAIIGAGTSMYQADQQKKAAEEQQQRLEAERAAKEAEAARVAALTRPEEQSAKSVKFGSDTNQDSGIGSVNDFLIPKKSTTLGIASTNGGSPLGFQL